MILVLFRSSPLLVLLVLTACGDRRSAGTEPLSLLGEAPDGSETSVEFRHETRRALRVEVGTELEFDVTLPEAPVLRFAIAASSPARPTLLAPVVFRVLVGETEVFREVVRRSQGERWLPRTVALSRWSGRRVRVALEASLGDGGIPNAKDDVVALWGAPLVSSQKAAPERPGLILISVDCLRADHVGSYGYPRATTPNLDAFARQAVRFEDAMASSSYTLPTHASMLTGLPPSLHGATARRRISSDIDYLPELLATEGYRVQGLVSGPFLSSAYGFDEGFHTYRLTAARAEGLVDQALALLDEGAGTSQFLFLHFFDVHAPYSPPAEFVERFGTRPEDISRLLSTVEKRLPPENRRQIEELKNLYDAEIAYVDREIGRFFEGLRKRGLYDSSLIVVTADHGEAFYEHGLWEHSRPWKDEGLRMYQEVLHVPLIVKWPQGTEGDVVKVLVSHADIFPTLLESAGIEAASPWGESLRRRREEGVFAEEPEFALSEFLSTGNAGGASLEVVLRRGHLKYFASFRAGDVDELYRTAPREEALYDLKKDPEELHPRKPGEEPEVEGIRGFVREYLRSALRNRRDSAADDVELDPELMRKLESLGYIEH